MMKKELLRFALYAIIIYLTGGTLNPAVAASQPSERNGIHFCGVDGQWNKRYSDEYPNRRYARTFAANLNVGEPRTVRMIYFLPNDRPYRADVVQRMKEDIRIVQTFYAEQMEAHGYGKATFLVETDAQGEPMVHRVDGRHPDSHYLDDTNVTVHDEIDLGFNLEANVYLIVIDNSITSREGIGTGGGRVVAGVGIRSGKNGGYALCSDEFSFVVVAHELGHVFGLWHDFRKGAYIMSYGPGQSRLSACHAEYLSVHPYFNLNTSTEEGEPPTIELISPRTYPAGSQSVPVRLKVNDSDGLRQLFLFVNDGIQVKACRGLAGDRDSTVEFDYDGVIPSAGAGPILIGPTSLSDPVVHPIRVEAVDTDGNVGVTFFNLVEISPHHIATLEGDTDGVTSVSFSPDGRTLASGAYDGTVKLWDVTTQQNIATLRLEGSSTAFSSDGTILASGSWDGTVKLWDIATQQNIATLEGHTAGINSVSFSLDGGPLASGSYDKTVKLWNVATRQSIATLEGHGGFVTSVSFSLDGGTLASGSYDKTVKLWNVATRQSIATLEGHTEGISSVSFSLDGRTLASGSWDSTVKLWDVATGVNFATLEGHTAEVTSVAFSPDGGGLASGSWDGTVKLWDVTTGENFITLRHTDAVLSVSFARVGGTLASGTDAGTVELWDTSEWVQLRLEAVAEVDIPDPNLRSAIVTALGKQPSGPILGVHLANLTYLDARNANISDLTGLEGATNLRSLELGGEYVEAEERVINSNSVLDFSPLTGLTELSLSLGDSNISDISAVASLTHLRELFLDNNNISDISAVVGLTNLTWLRLDGNSISDISAVSGLANLTKLWLEDNNISDISAVLGLTNLTSLWLGGNNISDISAVSGLTNLTSLRLDGNSISDISALAGLTNLTKLRLEDNNISDISAVSGLTNLTSLWLGGNSISDISAVSGLTNLTWLWLRGNSIADISAVLGLTELTSLWLEDNNISDISPLVANTGLGSGDKVFVQANPLSYLSIHTHIPVLQSRRVTVKFYNQAHPALLKISGDNQKGVTGAALEAPFVVEVQDANGSGSARVPVTFAVTTGSGTLSTTRTTTDANGRAESTLMLGPNPETNTISVSATGIEGTVTFHAISDTPFIEYILSIPAGISLIHIPLKVTAVDEIEKTIKSVGDVYDALGGTSRVNFLITYDSTTQGWLSYFVPSDKGSSADAALTDDTGIIAGLRTPVSIQLRGDPLGTDGNSAITLNQGLNLVGLPLRDSRIRRVSGLFALAGITDNVSVIIVSDNEEFKVVGRAGDPGYVEITGGQAFILTAQRMVSVTISGNAWANDSEAAAAPPLLLKGIEVGDTTPVLGLRGAIVDEGMGKNVPNFRGTIKNLSTGRAVATVNTPDEAGYRSTVVDIETGRAATVGDILEISARSSNPFIGVEPLRYTVTAEDVKRSLIQLPELVAYEIPSETQLLRNYPNPFNPETWIPYRLAEDASVTLTIYDRTGHVVRTLDVGHQVAAVYESRSKAVYWDGRNNVGEAVASGVYFYHLSAGDFSATRRMVILK